jgi:general stress protein 26
MQKPELRKKILDVIRNYPVGSLATVNDGKPWVRYMVIEAKEDLTMYTTAQATSRKTGQIRKNNNVHITFGHDPKNWMVPFINVVGTAEILTDPETKRQCWKEEYKQYYKGPDDPNYIVIKIAPEAIEYMDLGSRQPEVYRIRS